MPRFFKPLGGFPTKPQAKALRIGDDGDAHFILADGTEERTGYVGADQRWMPSYAVGEMENLVKGGSWIEVDSADADPGERPISPNAQPKDQGGPVVGNRVAAPQKSGAADPPPVAGGDPKSTNNPQPTSKE